MRTRRLARRAAMAIALVAGSLAHPATLTAAEPSLQRVLVAPSAGQVSLMLEMTDEPRRVWSQQISDTEVLLEAGPIAPLARRQILNAPDGMAFIKQVAVEQGRSSTNETLLRVRITLRQTTPSSVRVVGRRIYVDLIPVDASPRLDAPKKSTAGVTPAPAGDAPSIETFRAAVGPAIARFNEIQPFLLSTTASAAPSPSVLAALADAIGTVQQTLRAVPVPAAAESSHRLLIAACREAADAVTKDFAGDRAAKVKEAATLLAAAKAALQ